MLRAGRTAVSSWHIKLYDFFPIWMPSFRIKTYINDIVCDASNSGYEVSRLDKQNFLDYRNYFIVIVVVVIRKTISFYELPNIGASGYILILVLLWVIFQYLVKIRASEGAKHFVPLVLSFSEEINEIEVSNQILMFGKCPFLNLL